MDFESVWFDGYRQRYMQYSSIYIHILSVRTRRIKKPTPRVSSSELQQYVGAELYTRTKKPRGG